MNSNSRCSAHRSFGRQGEKICGCVSWGSKHTLTENSKNEKGEAGLVNKRNLMVSHGHYINGWLETT